MRVPASRVGPAFGKKRSHDRDSITGMMVRESNMTRNQAFFLFWLRSYRRTTGMIFNLSNFERMTLVSACVQQTFQLMQYTFSADKLLYTNLFLNLCSFFLKINSVYVLDCVPFKLCERFGKIQQANVDKRLYRECGRHTTTQNATSN